MLTLAPCYTILALVQRGIILALVQRGIILALVQRGIMFALTRHGIMREKRLWAEVEHVMPKNDEILTA